MPSDSQPSEQTDVSEAERLREDQILLKAEKMAERREIEEMPPDLEQGDQEAHAFALFLSGLVDVKMIRSNPCDKTNAEGHAGVGMHDRSPSRLQKHCPDPASKSEPSRTDNEASSCSQRLVVRATGRILPDCVPQGLIRVAYMMMEEEEENGEVQVALTASKGAELPSTRILRARKHGLSIYIYGCPSQDPVSPRQVKHGWNVCHCIARSWDRLVSFLRRYKYAGVFLGGMIIFSTANSLAVHLMLFRVGPESAGLMVFCAALLGAEIFCVHYFVFHAE
jgi:hypothetical protein